MQQKKQINENEAKRNESISKVNMKY